MPETNNQTWVNCTPVNYRMYIEQTDGKGNYRWRRNDETGWKQGRSPTEESPADCQVVYNPIR